MLLAATEALEMSLVGSLVVAFGAFCAFILTILLSAVAIKNLMKRDAATVDPNLAPVGKFEFTSGINEIKLLIGQLAPKESVTALSSRLQSLEKEHEKLERYTHTALHKVLSNLQKVTTNIGIIGIKLGVHFPNSVSESSDDIATGHGRDDDE